MSYIVTIDGPSASGKTTTSRELARRLGWHWVSTGAFYRGLALVAKLTHSDLNDEVTLVKLTTDPRWQIKLTHERTEVWYNGEEVTKQIHDPEIGNLASHVSKMPEVRAALLTAQRNCALNVTGLIAEGRDCGTVVFPQADLKIYLTAESTNRAERRATELGLNTNEIASDQNKRDKQDSSRAVAPLTVPEGSFVLDSTQLSLSGVVDVLEKQIRSRLKLS